MRTNHALLATFLLLPIACGGTTVSVPAQPGASPGESSPGPGPGPSAPPPQSNPSSCLGTTPTAIATVDDEHAAPWAVTVHGGDVYWSDMRIGSFAEDFHQGVIQRTPACGGATTTLATGQSEPTTLAADASGVYWLNTWGDQIEVMNLATGSKTPVRLAYVPRSKQGIVAGGLALDATDVYWSDIDLDSFDSAHTEGIGRVMRVSKAGGDPVVVTTLASSAASLTLAGSDIYWLVVGSSQSVLYALAKSGGTVRPIASTANGTYWENVVLTDSQFFASGDFVTVQSIPKAGGAATTISTGGRIAHLAADSAGAYWTDIATPGSTRIMGAPATGGAAVTLATSPSEPDGIVVANGVVYWTQGTGNKAALMAVAAPWGVAGAH